MPLVGLQYGAQRLNWQQAKSESQAGVLPFPLPLVAAMADNRDDAVPSASVLAGCLRQFQLKRRTDYYERPADLLPSVFGTAFHAWMERYTDVDRPELVDYLPGGGVEYTRGGPRHRELRLRTTVDLGLAGYHAVEVAGICDFLHEGVVVRDWKSKKFLPQGFEPPVGHKRQVNVYNWLAAENGYTPAPEWELVYVSQSWLSRFFGKTHPLARVGDWVRERLHEWALYESVEELVPPLAELFQVDERTKKPVAPCAYCPVRDACLAAWRGDKEAPF